MNLMKKLLKNSGLLITKPKLYVCNVDEESIKKVIIILKILSTNLVKKIH